MAECPRSSAWRPCRQCCGWRAKSLHLTGWGHCIDSKPLQRGCLEESKTGQNTNRLRSKASSVVLLEGLVLTWIAVVNFALLYGIERRIQTTQRMHGQRSHMLENTKVLRLPRKSQQHRRKSHTNHSGTAVQPQRHQGQSWSSV